jgi:tRNA A37 threonylcarbamoyladenosine synthetase subunit TsaC/SUA5/YrdC
MKCSGLAGSSVCASRGIVFFPRALAARGVLHSRGCTLGSAVGGQLLRRGCCRTPTMATVAATQPQQAQSDSCAEDMATASVLISPGAWQSQVEAAGIQHDPVLPASDAAALSHAAELLRSGQLMAIPTETVYGLAANALDSKAVKRIYAAKQRPADNPLIIHISSLDMLASLYPEPWQLPQVYSQVVEAFWPGPLTILLPRSPKVTFCGQPNGLMIFNHLLVVTPGRHWTGTAVHMCLYATQVPEEVTCGQPTMAVRMPAHPVARALIALSGVPLAAPSANSSGKPSPTTAAHVLQDLSGRIPLVVDGGACGVGLESTVRCRAGGILDRSTACVTYLLGASPAESYWLAAGC